MTLAVLADSLLLAVLSGLAGAPHCTIMCGGIVSSFAVNAQSAPYRSVLAYTAGKTVTYACVGAFMGGAGAFLDYAGRLVGVQGIACLLGGLLILLWAWNKYTLPIHNWSLLQHKLADRALRGLRRRHEGLAAFAAGLLLGFLPCGLTYAMQMQAAASGSWLSGLLILLVFGLSTIPALAAVGLFAGRIGKKWRGPLRKTGAALAVFMGILAIMKGLSANGVVPSIHPWLW